MQTFLNLPIVAAPPQSARLFVWLLFLPLHVKACRENTTRMKLQASYEAGQNRQNVFFIDGNRLLDYRFQLGGPRPFRLLGDLA
jgi:hypothetical protein